MSSTPADPAELTGQVVAIWAEVLDRPVGPADHFFDLGGNSLDAVRIVGRVEELVGEPVEVATLFETLTPAALARRLAGLPAHADGARG